MFRAISLFLLFSQTGLAASVGYVGASNFVRIRSELQGLCPSMKTFVQAESSASPLRQRKKLYPLLKAEAIREGAWPLDLLVISPSANAIAGRSGHLNPSFVRRVEAFVALARKDGVRKIALSNIGPKWPEPRLASVEFNELFDQRKISAQIDVWLELHSPLVGEEPGVCAYCTRERRASHWTSLGQARVMVSLFNQLWTHPWGEYPLPESARDYEEFKRTRGGCMGLR